MCKGLLVSGERTPNQPTIMKIEIHTVKAASMVRTVTGTKNGTPFIARRGRPLESGNGYSWEMDGPHYPIRDRAFSRKMNSPEISVQIVQKAEWSKP